MRQTIRSIKKKIRKARRFYRIADSVCRHRRTYLRGVRSVGKTLREHLGS